MTSTQEIDELFSDDHESDDQSDATSEEPIYTESETDTSGKLIIFIYIFRYSRIYR